MHLPGHLLSHIFLSIRISQLSDPDAPARHRNTICSFNDDIQGTAAVTVAAIVSGPRTSDVPLNKLRLVVVGAGTAGTGIAEQAIRALVSAGLSETDACSR